MRGLPSKKEILDFVEAAGGDAPSRDVARAFGLNQDQRRELRAMMRELRTEGTLGERRPGRRAPAEGRVPHVLPMRAARIDDDGDLIAVPLDDSLPGLEVRLPHESMEAPAPGIGDRLLVKIFRQQDGSYEGRVNRVLPKTPREVVGVVEKAGAGFRLRPAERRATIEYRLKPGEVEFASGDLVRAHIVPGRHLDLPVAEAVERLGTPDDPRTVSLLSAIEAELPMVFPDDALELAAKAQPVDPAGRTDLRPLDLVTIDGEDARDFDDAVFAVPDEDPKNRGGFRIVVAIADVSHYVRPDDALDREAKKRGNSVYFPDRVIPMLPEKLSNDLCSLRPHEDRACIACDMVIGADGELRQWRFVRGVMNSRARLTYNQVEALKDGQDDAVPTEVRQPVLRLFDAYRVLRAARDKRGAIDLDVPERRVFFDEADRPAGFRQRERLEANQLIEELMIAANVAAASELEKRKAPALYRVHDKPDALKLAALAGYMRELGLPWDKTAAKPGDFTRLLARIDDPSARQIASQLVLRAQAQAIYHPDNIGHFGLNLRRYAHFTSPIRRYADLIVHRSLVRELKLGEGGLTDDQTGEALYELGTHLSATERKAMAAERMAYERFVALFMRDQVGATFAGMVSSVQRFGLFVSLTDSGAEGLVHVASLGRDDWVHDEARHTLIGRHTGDVFALGDHVTVELAEVDELNGRLQFRLVEHEPGAAGIMAAREWASGKKRRSNLLGRRQNRGGGNQGRRRY